MVRCTFQPAFTVGKHGDKRIYSNSHERHTKERYAWPPRPDSRKAKRFVLESKSAEQQHDFRRNQSPTDNQSFPVGVLSEFIITHSDYFLTTTGRKPTLSCLELFGLKPRDAKRQSSAISPHPPPRTTRVFGSPPLNSCSLEGAPL